MYSYEPPHMAVQKQDEQHEHTFSNYVRIRGVVLKTCLGWWTIGKCGERGSGISVLPAQHDDDIYSWCVCVCVCLHFYMYAFIFMYMCLYVCIYFCIHVYVIICICMFLYACMPLCVCGAERMTNFENFTKSLTLVPTNFIDITVFTLNQHLTNLSLGNNIFYVVTIFIDAFLKAFLEVDLHSLPHCSVNFGNFNENSFFEFLQRMGLMLIHMCFEGSPQEIITNGQIRGLRGVSKTGNEVVTEERVKHIHQCSVCEGCHFILLKPQMS